MRSTSTGTQIGHIDISGNTAMWFQNAVDFGGQHHLWLAGMQFWIGIAQDMGYILDKRFYSVRDSSTYTTVSLITHALTSMR